MQDGFHPGLAKKRDYARMQIPPAIRNMGIRNYADDHS
jgi:hypothetical protein